MVILVNLSKPGAIWTNIHFTDKGRGKYLIQTKFAAPPILALYLLLGKTSEADPLFFHLKSTDSAPAVGMKARINLRDVWPPSLFVLLFLEGPTVAAVSLTAPDDFESFDETKEASDVPTNEIGPLSVLSRACPTAPSWWGGGNFSLLLLVFGWFRTLHRWRSTNETIVTTIISRKGGLLSAAWRN